MLAQRKVELLLRFYRKVGRRIFVLYRSCIECVLGIEQVIDRVTQWPGQEARNQQGKIPTLVWYDRDGKVPMIQ